MIKLVYGPKGFGKTKIIKDNVNAAAKDAKGNVVFITDEKAKEALVIVDQENLSLAIGKKGLNVKLASRLTKYKIDVKTEAQAKELGINLVVE